MTVPSSDLAGSFPPDLRPPVDLMPQSSWPKRIGSFVDDRGSAIAVDSNGDVIIAGYFYSASIDLGSGPLINAMPTDTDIVLARYRSNGDLVWAQRLGGIYSEVVAALAIDAAGNIVLAGSFTKSTNLGGSTLTAFDSSDAFVAKYAADGKHLWSMAFGGSSYDSASSVAVDSNGNIVVGGSFTSGIDFGGGVLTSATGSLSDVFLAKLSPAGGHIFSKAFGGPGSHGFAAVSVDSNNNIIAAVNTNFAIDLGGGVLTPNTGNGSGVLAKFDMNGNYAWAKLFNGDLSAGISALAVDKTGSNIVIAGRFASEVIDFGGGPLMNSPGCFRSANPWDIFIARFDGSGAHKGSKSFGNCNDASATSVLIDTSGEIVMMGTFIETMNFGGPPLTAAGLDRKADSFALKLKADGSYSWSKRFGGSADDFGAAGALSSTGDIYGIGFFSGTADFFGTSLSSLGRYNAFIVKLPAGG